MDKEDAIFNADSYSWYANVSSPFRALLSVAYTVLARKTWRFHNNNNHGLELRMFNRRCIGAPYAENNSRTLAGPTATIRTALAMFAERLQQFPSTRNLRDGPRVHWLWKSLRAWNSVLCLICIRVSLYRTPKKFVLSIVVDEILQKSIVRWLLERKTHLPDQNCIKLLEQEIFVDMLMCPCVCVLSFKCRCCCWIKVV